MTSSRSWLVVPRLALQWSLIFVGLFLSLWAATQSRNAPPFILLVVLTVLAHNFAVPSGRLSVHLLPVLGVLGGLVLGWPGVLGMTVVGLVLAEVTGSLWQPLWQRTNYRPQYWLSRLLQGVIHLVAVIAAATVYIRSGGLIPFTAELLPTAAAPLLWYILAYTLTTLLLTGIWHAFLSRSLTTFWREEALSHLAYNTLGQPFALIGSLIFANLGLLPFTIFSVGLGIFIQMNWLSWQRRTILQQQVNQFAAINQVGDSLRETLDPDTVLERTYQQIRQLLPVDVFALALVDEEGNWREPLRVGGGSPAVGVATYVPDGFVLWVAERGRVLDLDHETMPFARQHSIRVPDPLPAYWLGLPLRTSERVIGVMSLQRFDPQQPFSRWNREVLQALAGQAGVAIENARRHSETVRLYTLTDEALARRLEQLQALLDSTRDGVLMLDGSGRVALINPIAVQLLGHPPITLHDVLLEPERDAAALGYTAKQWQQLLTSLAEGRTGQSQRHLFTRTAGSQMTHLERHEGPVVAANGQVMGWLMVFRDVTEEQEQAAWRTEFTRMIVHDLRNPVTTLLSIIHLLDDQLKQMPAVPETTELVETARRGCVGLLDMIDSLMDINRMEAGQLIVDADALALRPQIEKVLAHVRPLARRQEIAIHFDCPPDIPFVWADEDLMRRVWLNLLDNALKFTPAGGHVTVHLQMEPPFSSHDEPGVRAWVQDTGPGIPVEYRERVFDRFVRINRGGAQVRGTGLGLTFCKMVVEAHRGRIWVEDAPSGGSCFFFTLPGIPILTE